MTGMSSRMTGTGIPITRAGGRKVARYTKKRLRAAQALEPLRARAVARANDVRRQRAEERQQQHR